jgi:uncharacterized membrane protein
MSPSKSRLPDDTVRPLVIVMFAHVAAVLGVIGHTGATLSGLSGTAYEANSILWNIVIAVWLISLLTVGWRMFGPAYQTRTWELFTYVLAVMTGVGLIHLVYMSGAESIYTDVMLFMRYSADLVIAGQNPYVEPMSPAFERYQTLSKLPSVTERVDGSVVNNISYPALSFLVFVPQRLLGLTNISLTVVVFFVLTLLFLVREAPSVLFTTVVAGLFFNQYLVSNAVFGNIDFVWIFPLLIGMHYWYRGRLVRSTVAVGLAFAVKPIAWFIAPFAAVWLWTAPERFGRTRSYAIAVALVAGFVGFLLPNLPYLLNAPGAWALDVLSAVGSRVPFRTRGTGLAVFTYTSVLPIPKVGFRFILMTVLGASLVVYYRYFEQLKWIAWVMPAFILWFNDRALLNYFVSFIPIAYYAILVNREIVPKRPLLSVGAVTKLQTAIIQQSRTLLTSEVDD